MKKRCTWRPVIVLSCAQWKKKTGSPARPILDIRTQAQAWLFKNKIHWKPPNQHPPPPPKKKGKKIRKITYSTCAFTLYIRYQMIFFYFFTLHVPCTFVNLTLTISFIRVGSLSSISILLLWGADCGVTGFEGADPGLLVVFGGLWPVVSCITGGGGALLVAGDLGGLRGTVSRVSSNGMVKLIVSESSIPSYCERRSVMMKITSDPNFPFKLTKRRDNWIIKIQLTPLYQQTLGGIYRSWFGSFLAEDLSGWNKYHFLSERDEVSCCRYQELPVLQSKDKESDRRILPLFITPKLHVAIKMPPAGKRSLTSKRVGVNRGQTVFLHLVFSLYTWLNSKLITNVILLLS